MKEIKLSQRGKNKGLFTTMVDDEDFEYLNQWKWSVFKTANLLYVIRMIHVDGGRRQLFMHRDLLGVPNNMFTDHVDHNGLNNQKHNIRICTNKENQCNRRSFGASKYLGVCVSRGKWQAQIRCNNKRQYLGRFKTEIDAAKAYDVAALKMHGEFANLNFK